MKAFFKKIKNFFEPDIPILFIIAVCLVPVGICMCASLHNDALREAEELHHANLARTYKYVIIQYKGGKNGGEVRYYTNEYELIGVGVEFKDENGRVSFVSGNYSLQTTK